MSGSEARRRRMLRTALIGSLAIFAISAGDLLITSGREGLAADISEGLHTRGLIAGVGVSLIWLMYAGFTVRREPGDRAAWVIAFRDVGTAGVAWIVLAGALMLASAGAVELPGAFLLIPAAVLPAVAILGGVVSRRAAGVEALPEPDQTARTLGAMSQIGLAAAALTAALLAIAILLLDGSCSTEREPVAETFFWAGLVSGLISVLLGVVSLPSGHWARALICILAPPITYIAAYVLSGCVN